jgi:hypothetical protein
MATKKKSKKKTSKKAKKSVNYAAVVANEPQPETIFTTSATANTEDLPPLTDEEINASEIINVVDSYGERTALWICDLPRYTEPNAILINAQSQIPDEDAELKETFIILDYDDVEVLVESLEGWLATHESYPDECGPYCGCSERPND